MRALVRQAMSEGAFGLSTGLFYVPGYYATTAEVIELTRVAAAFDGIYDTHDRDLGASYRGVGYLESIREAIRIGEAAGARVVFSHFNAQGASNYGRAPEGGPASSKRRGRGVWRWRRRSTSTRRPSRVWPPMRYPGGPRTAAARTCSNASGIPRPSAGSTSRRWRCSRFAAAPTSSCSPTRGRR